MPGKLETGKVENMFFSFFFRFGFHFLHRFFHFHFHFFSFCKFVVNFGFHIFFILVFIFFRFGFHFFILVFIFFHFSLASVIFGGLKPSLANLIWTKPAKTEANEKKTKKMKTKMKTKTWKWKKMKKKTKTTMKTKMKKIFSLASVCSSKLLLKLSVDWLKGKSWPVFPWFSHHQILGFLVFLFPSTNPMNLDMNYALLLSSGRMGWLLIAMDRIIPRFPT